MDTGYLTVGKKQRITDPNIGVTLLIYDKDISRFRIVDVEPDYAWRMKHQGMGIPAASGIISDDDALHFIMMANGVSRRRAIKIRDKMIRSSKQGVMGKIKKILRDVISRIAIGIST